MTRVLVTGCAGFIGSNLCAQLLRAGHRVSGLDDLSQGLRAQVPAAVKFHQLDICSDELGPAFAGVDVVFHLAARNCLSECLRDPVATVDVNIRGTVRVLEACRAARVDKIVYAGTSAVYEGLTVLPARENQVAPIGPYAVAKHAGANFVRSYGALHGLRSTILRYFNVYGPAQDHRRAVPPVMSAFALALLQGRRPTIYGDGRKRRDFVYVDDVNSFHLQCLTNPATDGRTFDLGRGENYSVLEIYEAVMKLLGAGIPPVFEPGLPGEAAATLADPAPAKSLGWRPVVGLSTGIAKTIEYLRREVLPGASVTGRS